ncbi:HU family DNA-binding protein [Sphingomonas aurantiaca]|uniref:HU family DNA-binding protein n=1 Tax=Sphingomonas aurantiaca TaxID=185949 RepID=UPI002FE28AE6
MSVKFEQSGAAAKSDGVFIPDFGRFTVEVRPKPQRRNFATGGAMTIAASKKVSFTTAKG